MWGNIQVIKTKRMLDYLKRTDNGFTKCSLRKNDKQFKEEVSDILRETFSDDEINNANNN